MFCYQVIRQNVKGHLPLRMGSKFELGSIFTSNTSNYSSGDRDTKNHIFFWLHHLGRGQRSKFKFTIGSIGCKKSRVAKTGASQKQYHF